jgi:hypothetical protein
MENNEGDDLNHGMVHCTDVWKCHNTTLCTTIYTNKNVVSNSCIENQILT